MSWVEKLDPIEAKVFGGSDHPLDARRDVYEHFRALIDANLDLQQLDADWDEKNWQTAKWKWTGDVVIDNQVQICMLFRLMSHFPSPEITIEDAEEWRRRTLLFFEKEYKDRYDELGHQDIDDYRQRIIANYDRLIPLLCSGDDDFDSDEEWG